MGLAIFNDVIIDIKFPKVIYKKLLNINVGLEDLREIDQQMYDNLVFLRDTQTANLEETIGACFEVEVENFGHREALELKPNGSNIMISQENKLEYIDLYLNWKFNTSIESYFRPFYKGFYRVADEEIFNILEFEELELIICGTPDLDFDELKEGCHVIDGYNKDSITVIHFWEVLSEFDIEKKKLFLFFLSGCDRSPIKGLASLKMVIGRQGPDSDKLPSAHTCFNYLLLPDYQNKDKLRDRLLLAIENSEGFGLM